MTHPIENYLEKHELKATEFAGQINISRVSLYRIIKGTQVPSKDLVKRIMEASNGELTPADLWPDVFLDASLENNNSSNLSNATSMPSEVADV